MPGSQNQLQFGKWSTEWTVTPECFHFFKLLSMDNDKDNDNNNNFTSVSRDVACQFYRQILY